MMRAMSQCLRGGAIVALDAQRERVGIDERGCTAVMFTEASRMNQVTF